jgi:hypothetical protein
MTDTVPVSFKWILVTPDTRAYKPSAPQLEPMQVVVIVEVPLDAKYIANVETYNSSVETSVLLTPKGMQYCISELEGMYAEEKAKVEWDEDEFSNDPVAEFETNADPEEWDDADEFGESEETETSDDDFEWEDETETDAETELDFSEDETWE